MKPSRIAFICSIIIFLVSWGIKVNMPVDRPSNYEDDLQEAWYEKEYSHIYGDDEWYLSTSDTANYVKLDGYESIYQCENADGSISYYRQKKDESGTVKYVKIEDFIP